MPFSLLLLFFFLPFALHNHRKTKERLKLRDEKEKKQQFIFNYIAIDSLSTLYFAYC